MKYLTLLTLLFFGLCAQASDNNQLFYYLKISTANVKVQCFVNGFPVYEIKTDGEVMNQVPINLALVGENNELKIIAKPLSDNAFIGGSIALYGGGDIVSSDDDKEGVLTFNFNIEDKTTKTFTFNNDRFDFSDILTNTPVIDDEDRIINYAVEILAMIERRDTKALLEQLEPKISDYAESFSVEKSLMVENMKMVLNESVFFMQRDKVQRGDIKPEAHCGGRVWELRANGHPLIYTINEETAQQMEIYVAEVDGVLRIVR